jgi:hypothetical protein
MLTWNACFRRTLDYLNNSANRGQSGHLWRRLGFAELSQSSLEGLIEQLYVIPLVGQPVQLATSVPILNRQRTAIIFIKDVVITASLDFHGTYRA